MSEWSFEHAVATRASRADAWAFWSDLRNHMRLDPGVKRIELDGAANRYDGVGERAE